MRLFIAEKPDLGRAIADALPQPHKREDNCIRCGNNDVVTWCVGHIMELENADAYDESFKKWTLEPLPIIPSQWKLKVTKGKVFSAIRKLIGQATEIVNAGDPDREGQLLVDEVIYAVGTSAPINRVLISDLNLPAVKKAISKIGSNDQYRSLYDAALARQRADWAYGINLTRLYTLLGQAGGYDGVLSVGRVQTPLLGLVVRRDLEIESFEPKPFYEIFGNVRVDGGTFKGKWVPGDKDAEHLDEESRLISKTHAAAIKNKIDGQHGFIETLTYEKKKENAPKPFSLASLQILAAKRFNYDADKTLEIAQSLYEKHKLITYPRSDCEYLPKGQLDNVDKVFAAINANLDETEVLKKADKSIVNACWNDKKVSAHHAIIPTDRHFNISDLSTKELSIYELVCERYLLQFYEAFEYQQTDVVVLVADERLKALGKAVINEGWKSVFSQKDDQDEKEEGNTRLPELRENMPSHIACSEVANRTTSAPKRFTMATLISAMSGIGRYVTDPEVKKILNENDGIGTPATQASIIKTLFDRSFLAKQGKNILSTEIGRSFISILPESATLPDLTAFWEKSMSNIVSGDDSLEAFLDQAKGRVEALVDEGKKLEKLDIQQSTHECPKCQKPLVRRKGKFGHFWSCSDYPNCDGTVPDKAGKPDYKALETHPCPSCGKDMKRRKGSQGFFWGCTGYPDCKTTLEDKRGKPVAPAKEKKPTKTEAKETTFQCGACGSPLVRRKSKNGASYWYGCSAFPKCKQTYQEQGNAPKF